MPYTNLEIRAIALQKSFGATTVLDGVDLSVTHGRVFALLGPNGAGKTTTVRILSTLERPDGGHAMVAGHDVVREAGEVRAAISLTGQFAAVDELLTAEENLRMVGRLSRLSRPQARDRAAELIERFELSNDRSRLVKTFSGGMRRKVDLAMSLVGRPQILFLDEPTTGLDLPSRQAMWALISDLVADDVTVFLTTQYLEEADRLAHRIAVIDGGRIVAEGSPDLLKQRVGTEQLELTFANSLDIDRALQALDSAAVLASEPGRLTLATDGSAEHVRHVLNRMADARVEIDALSLHRPSLDDVFLALTGSPASSAHAGDSVWEEVA